jgi:hypothetical protein
MRKSNRKIFLYHITYSSLWGKQITLFPKHITCCCEDEPNIERICVCPDIVGCLTAMSYFYSHLYIYRTKYPVCYYYPYDVFDVKATRERWLLEKTLFIKVFNINSDIADKIPKGNGNYLSQQKRDYERIKRFLIKNKIPLTFENRR